MMKKSFLFLVLWCSQILASQPSVYQIEGFQRFLEGSMVSTTLLPSGDLIAGPIKSEWIKKTIGPISASVIWGQQVLAATTNPGKIWLISQNKEPKVVFETDRPLITAMVPLADGKIAVLVGPQGGVHVLDTTTWKSRYIPVSEVDLLLGATLAGKDLLLVGGGNTGRLMKLENGKDSTQVLLSVEENYLRSVLVDRTNTSKIFLGGAEQGIIYMWQDKKLSALFDSGASEVTSLVQDEKGRLFASIVDTSGNISAGAVGKAKPLEESPEDAPAKKDEAIKEVYSSEVLRIDTDGRVEILWQSKTEAAYSLLLSTLSRQLLVGTGPRGNLYALNPDKASGASVLVQLPEQKEIMKVQERSPGEYVLSTAFTGNVVSIQTRELLKNGVYLSGPLDAGAPSIFGQILINGQEKIKLADIWMRTGNTPKPDDTWSSFIKQDASGKYPGLPIGQWVQVKIILSNSLVRINQVRISGRPLNRSPRISDIQLLPVGVQLLPALQEPAPVTRLITIDQDAFADLQNFGPEAIGSKRPSQAQMLLTHGFQTVVVFAEDPDQDTLRYQFRLEKLSDKEASQTKLLQDFMLEPFVSFDTAKLADGRYRVWVTVDDLAQNGPVNAKLDEDVSPIFEVANQSPLFKNIAGQQKKNAVRLRFDVDAKLPLALVRCVVGQGDWIAVDPIDGLTDSMHERYDVTLPGDAWFKSASCEAVDEAEHQTRVDIPLGS